MPTETKAKKRITPSVMPGGAPALALASLRLAAQSEPKLFLERCQKLIDGGLRWQNIDNLRALRDALSDLEVPAYMIEGGQARAIMASAFPLLAGGITVAGISDAYDAVPTIGQELVTDTEDARRFSTYANILSEDTNADGVKEGDDFPEIGAGEEKYTIGHKRNGRRISITQEMIDENDISGIVQRVDALGEIGGSLIEEQTLRRVCDIDGSAASPAEPYALHPSGAGASLYSATANTPGTRAPSGTRVTNNALVDTSSLEAARRRIASMLDSRGKRIATPVSQCTLLTPDALAPVALKILGSELEPGVENELNNWGPRGVYRPRFLSSPKVDDLSTTAWYYGNFKKQFKRKWKLRFESVSMAMDMLTYLKSRVAFQGRLAWDCEIGAIDYVYVVQCLPATTAPTP